MSLRDGFRVMDLYHQHMDDSLLFTQLSTVPVFSCYNNHCITNKFLSVHISCAPLLVLAGLIYVFIVAVKC